MKDWPPRQNLEVGCKNVVRQSLVSSSKVVLPCLHIKRGLMKQLVKALNKEGGCFKYMSGAAFKNKYANRKVQDNRQGLELNGLHQLLVYVDDVNILGDSSETKRENTEILLEASKAIGLYTGEKLIPIANKNGGNNEGDERKGREIQQEGGRNAARKQTNEEEIKMLGP
ncbi:hypothetical protein ANN_26963 [Periplaneta americana]|uniref:Reverse transcriptase domain-containing protein n=1 Tax=Periplaneta americana TaxID=6978 RepID=A0ABQ8RWW7_PERAM|nr:hypothetical protein ANN_26963 [Periplaneta americana]